MIRDSLKFGDRVTTAVGCAFCGGLAEEGHSCPEKQKAEAEIKGEFHEEDKTKETRG